MGGPGKISRSNSRINFRFQNSNLKGSLRGGTGCLGIEIYLEIGEWELGIWDKGGLCGQAGV